MYALLLVVLLQTAGDASADTIHTDVPSPKTLPPVTVKVDTTNRLARAIQRLKGEPSRSPKSGHRTIHLLGGKLSARVPRTP